MRAFLVIVTVWAMPLSAQDAFPLTGDQIAAALTGRSVVYAGGETQDFRTSGRTLYNAGHDSWGYWAIRGDQYCSQWPPADGWACYDVLEVEQGVRFIGADGSFSDGIYTQ